jgi:hypothetical protein
MSRAPWLLQKGRSGYRMGMPSDQIFDAMVLDGLWCAWRHHGRGQILTTFRHRQELQNEVAYRASSTPRAIRDGSSGEIVPWSSPKGDRSSTPTVPRGGAEPSAASSPSSRKAASLRPGTPRPSPTA